MKLVWNGIVRNESAILERCVNSLLPHIDGAVVVDTGSSDGTPELLERLFDQAGKPLELHHGPFLNFSHARNLALAAARASAMSWDWLLLADADMSLTVSDPNWIKKLNGGLSYDLKQKAGALEYYNRRLVSREATGEFIGVTHEFLDIPSSGVLASAEFVDFADGANRAEKLPRDIALLEDALRTETRPGVRERYTFYLAQTNIDLGNFEQAAKYYKQRVEMGGFGEEQWYAQMQYARCLGQMGDRPGFLWGMLRAYQMRPQRAETLYELSKHFREQGENHASLLFSEAGLQLPYPKSDSLFLNSWIHEQGLKEEFSICAYYDERRRSRGAKECDRLALAGSEQARGNQYWYLQPLGLHVPSFHFKAIKFDPPEGYVACNPSVMANKEEPLFLVRTVNYTINADGGYDIRDGDGHCSNTNPIRTRNFLVDSQHAIELESPWNMPPEYSLVCGLEDSRLFEWGGHLYTISTVRELNPEGWCEQVMAHANNGRYEHWNKILPKERRHEKNWMPWVRDGDLRFVYRLGTLIDADGKVVVQHDPGLDVRGISGGSQVVEIDERTNLAVVHEARTVPGRYNRYYQHRFVNFHRSGRVDKISAPFFFHDRQIEFCAGLAYFPAKKQLMASYGVRDCEAWAATMDVEEVLRFIYRDAL